MYVDAYTEKDWDEILVVERGQSGKRREVTYPKKLVFYYDDAKGKYTSIFGNKVSQFKTTSQKAFQKELKLCSKRTYESDINPIFRCLSENYQDLPAPNLNVALFDIEVDMDPQRGYASPNDPFAAITAISIALAWQNRVITLVLAPKTIKDEKDNVVPLTKDLAKAICDSFPNTYLCDSEEQLLEAFLEIIEDADVISGWNSTGFDIPYLVNRIELKLSKDHTRKMCLWNLTPRKRIYTKFGKEHSTYDLVGRIHLDYLDLYMKHSPQQLHSYRLDFVAQIEVKAKKTPYEGSLYDLYHKDFRKFVEYNRQDVHLLVEIDKKCKYIELANQLAHTNCVLLPNTLGSVILIDQAIVNEAHRLGMVIPDRKRRDINVSDNNDNIDEESSEHDTVVGAYVANPKVGIHDWVGACDINSLYPSVIRSFNMGPETIVAQLRPTLTNDYVKKATENKVSDVWADMFGCLEYEEVINRTNADLIVDFENGEVKQMKAYEIYDWVFNATPRLCITANGTIFSYEKMGVIPSLLEKWYSERKNMQKKSKQLFAEVKTISDKEQAKKVLAEAEFWDKQQYIRKIQLNSLYGALLNPACKMYDERLGQSVTLSGRRIVRHMSACVNEILTGSYDYKGKCIVYGDTDSVTGDTEVKCLINNEERVIPIQELFEMISNKFAQNHKEYAVDLSIKVLTYDPKFKKPVYKTMDYVYRHNTEKELFEIELEDGKKVTVTEDHSVMVERDGTLIECKPNELKEDDEFIVVNYDDIH